MAVSDGLEDLGISEERIAEILARFSDQGPVHLAQVDDDLASLRAGVPVATRGSDTERPAASFAIDVEYEESAVSERPSSPDAIAELLSEPPDDDYRSDGSEPVLIEELDADEVEEVPVEEIDPALVFSEEELQAIEKGESNRPSRRVLPDTQEEVELEETGEFEIFFEDSGEKSSEVTVEGPEPTIVSKTARPDEGEEAGPVDEDKKSFFKKFFGD